MAFTVRGPEMLVGAQGKVKRLRSQGHQNEVWAGVGPMQLGDSALPTARHFCLLKEAWV